MPVVGLRHNAQKLAHELVNMDALKGLHLQACFEAGTHGPEDGLHVHVLVVEAVFTFVELDTHSLEGGRGKASGLLMGPECPQFLPLSLSQPPCALAPTLVDDLRKRL